MLDPPDPLIQFGPQPCHLGDHTRPLNRNCPVRLDLGCNTKTCFIQKWIQPNSLLHQPGSWFEVLGVLYTFPCWSFLPGRFSLCPHFFGQRHVKWGLNENLQRRKWSKQKWLEDPWNEKSILDPFKLIPRLMLGGLYYIYCWKNAMCWLYKRSVWLG